MTAYELFNIFFFKLSNHSIFLFEVVYRSPVLSDKNYLLILLILNDYFKYVNFIKNKSLWH